MSTDLILYCAHDLSLTGGEGRGAITALKAAHAQCRKTA